MIYLSINLERNEKMKKLFKCSVCNYIHEGTSAPDSCPKCGAPASAFQELDEATTKKVYESDETNDLLMELASTASKLIDLCERGIELKLDPACVSCFEKSKNALWSMKQNAKAEIQNHIAKSKW